MPTVKIYTGKTYTFEPVGSDRFPRFRIQRVDAYKPGTSILDHYRIDIRNSSTEDEIEERRTWADVRNYFKEIGLEDEFDRAFPGAQ